MCYLALFKILCFFFLNHLVYDSNFDYNCNYRKLSYHALLLENSITLNLAASSHLLSDYLRDLDNNFG